MDALTDKEATGKVEETEEIKQRVQADEEEDEEDQIKSQAHLDRRKMFRHYQLGLEFDLSGGSFKPGFSNLSLFVLASDSIDA